MDFITAWAVISTLGSAALGWILYRKLEVVKLAKDAYDAAVDKDITEAEFQTIAADLGAVLYKK